MSEQQIDTLNVNNDDDDSDYNSNEDLETSQNFIEQEALGEGFNDKEFDGDEDDTLSSLDDDIEGMSDEEFLEYVNSGKAQLAQKTGTENNDQISSNTQNIFDEENADKEEKKESQEDIKKEAEKQTSLPKDDISVEELRKVYDSVFKPFKANGKTITPRTVDDIESLMKMGANYTKKMQLIAPMRKVVETLNKASIDEKELNFLIDVYNGDTEAIKELLTKHKVDPFELDLETTNYVPKNNLASDEDVEYSNLVQDIDSSLPKIQEIITKQWDHKSKQLLLKDPQLLRALHEEIELGRFDEVQNRLELERVFGRYKGVSDVEAYVDLVTKMANSEKNTVSKTPSKQKLTTPNTVVKKVPDKSKAAPVRGKAGNHGTTLTAEDILSMPEEEFLKLTERDLV